MTTHTWTDGDVLYADDLNTSFSTLGFLGEIRQMCLSISGAETLASMITRGWAVCDGTTPASQGITDPTIATTPDLTAKFLYGHATTSGTTGGEDTHVLTATEMPSHAHTVSGGSQAIAGTQVSLLGPTGVTHDVDGTIYTSYVGGGAAHNNLPPYYTVVFMIKVK